MSMKPTGRQPSPGSPEDWLAHATSDLNMARLARGHREVLPAQVCFHAHQAAEKAPKAVLLFRGVEFPPVHVIRALVEIAQEAGLVVPPEVADATSLTPHAVMTRYPGFGRDLTPQDVDEAIRLAEQVVSWAAHMIAGRGASA